ncbi:hypothetical protein BJ912DRAFT_930372 [Pholiota molesta]|nr:hypothetical protein BJ912DRAFT_930372 [Pholiota molesta]
MSSNATDEISTAFFGNATAFNIGRGRFRTVAGNSYTGCQPTRQQLDSKAPSPTKSTNVYFHGASNFEIFEGDFDTIRGDAIDFPWHHNKGTKKNSEFLKTRGWYGFEDLFTFKPKTDYQNGVGLASRDSVPVKTLEMNSSKHEL